MGFWSPDSRAGRGCPGASRSFSASPLDPDWRPAGGGGGVGGWGGGVWVGEGRRREGAGPGAAGR